MACGRCRRRAPERLTITRCTIGIGCTGIANRRQLCGDTGGEWVTSCGAFPSIRASAVNRGLLYTPPAVYLKGRSRRLVAEYGGSSWILFGPLGVSIHGVRGAPTRIGGTSSS